MKVRDLLKMDIDIDVYDNVTEELAVAFCGPMELTEAGLRRFADVLEYPVTLTNSGSYIYATVDVDDPEDEDIWERKLEAAKGLFEGMAGLGSATDYELWFKDTGAKADIKPSARLTLCGDDMKELLFEVMESIEDMLEEHGGMVKNPERDEAIADYQKNGWDTAGICHLYGGTYADLQDTIKAVLATHGIIEED